MKKVINFTVNSEDKGKRLDIFLSEKMNNTRSEIKKMIDKELVLLNDKLPKKAGQSLKVGSNIKILEEKFKLGVDFTKKIKIIKDTNDYIIIDKPSGLLVHPTDRNEVNTLTDWLLSEYSQVKGVGESVDRPGIVHRLDKEASGVMVIAKNKKMFEHLKKQFKDRTISKYYTVLVHGILDMKHDKIDFDINRGHDGKMVARPKIDNFKVKNVGKEQEGREALTEYWVEKEYTRFSLLKVKIAFPSCPAVLIFMVKSGSFSP